MANRNEAKPKSTALVIVVMAALVLGFASTFLALRFNTGHAFADVSQVQIILGSTQATSELKITLTPQGASNPVGDLH